MKFYKIIGFAAAAIMIISCFIPWTYYADIGKSFNGFFSEKNMYGKPGKVFIFLAVISAALILINRIWAKRVLLFVAAINISYLIKSYVLFTTCYSALCPVKQYGLYLLMAGTTMLMIVSIFPDMKIQNEEIDE